jgi:ubiquinone/menaquinone biosynthesis C-methylase UbiE
MKLLLPERLVAKSGPTDPILYYYRGGGIGWLYRRRIEMGLEMIPPLKAASRILEVGYGAGLVLYNLASRAGKLHGLDLDADPQQVAERLAKLDVNANLVRGSVLDMRAIYPDAYFDLVVCFSTLEHLVEFRLALDEMDRVTAPGGYLLLGMPTVNRFMEVAFRTIGFKGINDHHVTSPRDVWLFINRQTSRWEIWHRKLPQVALFRTALYHTFLLRKRQKHPASAEKQRES